MKNTALTQNVQSTMSSLELLDVINSSREEHGQGVIRRNDFHARVTDELDGEYYETFVVENHNGTKTTAYKLNHDQCLLVAMRESKAVRRTVLSKLKAVEAGLPVASVPATLALVECAANLLRASDSGKVVMLRKAGEAIGADTSFLPAYTEDSAPGHVGAMDTASLTQLLRDSGVTISAARANGILHNLGFLDHRTRKTTSGGTKQFWCVTDAGLKYGKNVVSPKSPRETQPHWYRSTFADLLSLIVQEAAA